MIGKYNAQLKIVGDYDTQFYNVLEMASSIKVGDVKLDYTVNKGSRFGGVLNGLGILDSGRTIDISVPIVNGNKQLKTTDIIKQINNIYSLVSQSYNNKYYLVYDFDDELYSAEMTFYQAGGYSVKSVLDVGSISLKLKQLDNFFTSEYPTERKIEILEGSGAKHTQDIELNIDDTYTPTRCDFKFIMDISVSPFYLYFAHRSNYGISCSIDSLGILKDAVVEYKDNMLLINGVAYDYDGVQFMLNRGTNILFYESNAIAKDCRIFYKKSILI